MIGLGLGIPFAPPASGQGGLHGDYLRTELLPAGLDARYDGEGFLFGLGVNGSYDSNLFLAESGEESDFSANAAPWMQYRSAPPGGARVILEGRYSPIFRAYLENDQLNSLDHSGGGSLSYEGERAQASAGGTYFKGAESNRFAAGRTESERLTLNLLANYLISGKTSLEARSNFGRTVLSGSETDTFSAEGSAFWQATPLVKVGPTVRYARSDSDTIGDIEATSGLLTVDYHASDFINLRAQGGVETTDDDTGFTGGLTASYGSPNLPWSLNGDLQYARVQQLTSARQYGGGGDSRLTGSLGVDYSPGDLWHLNARAAYETVPSPTTTNTSINDFTLAVSATRELGSGSLGAGFSLSFSEYEAIGPVMMPRRDEETYSFYLTHRMGLFDDRVSLDTSARFSETSGGRDWSRFQFSTGLNYTF